MEIKVKTFLLSLFVDKKWKGWKQETDDDE
jgi:hypothetical protein